jgi:NhaA family Na+:H+ antiporter
MTVQDESAPTSPFQEFVRTEAATGALLVICAIAALCVVNSPWADAYHRLWTTPVAVVGGGHTLSLTLHQWINDGLMSVFFLLVGLEIKREAIAGELASPRQAALPIAAAIGGMIVPASIYFLANGGRFEARGWAVPMATDIAFALGALALVAPRAPADSRPSSRLLPSSTIWAPCSSPRSSIPATSRGSPWGRPASSC